MSRKKYKHSIIVNKIAKEVNLDRKVIHLIVRKFFNGLRVLMLRNEEINIQGFFILKLSSYYKKKIEKNGKNINLRRRRDQKYDYVKKKDRK